MAQLIKNPPAVWETCFNPWVGKIPWRRERLPTPVFWPEEFHGLFRASQVAQMVKHPLAMQETWVQSLGGEDPLEKEM